MKETAEKEQYILIIEDSPIDYEITTRALRKAGFEQPVHHCKSGDEAFNFLMKDNPELKEKGNPSLILLDLNLPGMDGKELLETIKTEEDRKEIPVIVLTTSGNEKDVEACYEKGANSYVKKPLAPDDYIEMARSLKAFWFDWACLPDGAC